MNVNPAALEWITYAEHDYHAAQVLLDSRPIPAEIVAYHCQQTAEKYLKSVLINTGIKVPFIHDLSVLNKYAQVYLQDLQTVVNQCDRLTPYGTITRYPGGILEVSEDSLTSIFKWASDIRSVIRKAFNL